LKSKSWSEDHPWWAETPADYKIRCKVVGIRAEQRIPHYDVRRLDGHPDSRQLTLPNTTHLTNALIEAETTTGDTLEIEWLGWKLTGKYKRATKFYRVKVAGKYDNTRTVPTDLLSRESWPLSGLKEVDASG